MRQLKFEVQLTDRASEYSDSESYIQAEVVPVVDGRPLRELLRTNLVFDGLSCLLQGTTPGGLNLFTCTCGIAECAGLLDEDQVVVGEASVTWRFSTKDYPVAESPGEADRFSIVFDRAQYEESLYALELALTEAADANAKFNIAPSSGPLTRRKGAKFKGQLAQWRKDWREQMKVQARYTAAEGQLPLFALQVPYGTDGLLRLNLDQLAYRLIPDDCEDRPAFIESVRDELLTSPVLALKSACKALQELPFRVVRPPSQPAGDVHAWLTAYQGPLLVVQANA